MTLSFREEPLGGCIDEASALMQMHWEEICGAKDVLKLNPDRAFYAQMEAANRTVCVTARERSDGSLRGYLLHLIGRHPHYSDIVTATDDVHFLHPDVRQGMNAARLIRAAEAFARARGATVHALRTKVNPAVNHSALLERMGYRATDVVHVKVLA